MLTIVLVRARALLLTKEATCRNHDKTFMKFLARKFSRVVLLSGGIAACGAVLKLGVRQAVTFDGVWSVWSAVGGGLIFLGAVLIIAALASRKETPNP